MGFSPASGRISAADDVAISNPTNSQVLAYESTTGLWRNQAATPGGTSLTATKDTATAGSVTLAGGSSPNITKFSSTLSAHRTITLTGTATNAYFDLSFIETDFNGFTIIVTNGVFSHVFSYPTYVRYIYIGSSWERVL